MKRCLYGKLPRSSVETTADEVNELDSTWTWFRSSRSDPLNRCSGGGAPPVEVVAWALFLRDSVTVAEVAFWFLLLLLMPLALSGRKPAPLVDFGCEASVSAKEDSDITDEVPGLAVEVVPRGASMVWLWLSFTR